MTNFKTTIYILTFLIVTHYLQAQQNVPLNASSLLDSLPADFPKITIDSSSNPAPGNIFMESISFSGKSSNYLMILNEKGNVLYHYKPFLGGVDFKMQPNGLFSYGSPVKVGDQYNAGPIKVQNVMVIENILDSSYNVIDSVQMKNGYLADIHEFVMLPNGNYLMLAYESVPTDMSKLINGGNPNAVVIGTVIQELDKNKNCIFQWRSLDHIPILNTKDNPLNTTFEHVHGNSLYLDTDGNLIASLPATLEIVKIDMISGKILWRLGGDNNQFDITGEHEENKPYYFSLQHDAKRLPNGNLLFYDNGVAHKPWYSRAVEYSLDEINKKASLVWEYRRTPDISAYAMGSAQRLSNGNTLINWGLIFIGLYKTLTEVTPDHRIVFELSIPSDAYSYRAFKYDLPMCPAVADVSINNIIGGQTYSFSDHNSNTGAEVYINQINASATNVLRIQKYDCSPLNPQFTGEAPIIMPCRFVMSALSVTSYNGELRFDFSKLPPRFLPDNMKVYYRPVEASGIFYEIPTQFNSAGNQIVATASGLGEYVLGFERTLTEILPPSLISPADNNILVNNKTVSLIWSPTGRYTSFQLQLAEDSLFTQMIKDQSNITATTFLTNLIPDKSYYWKVKTFYNNVSSDWSNIQRFTCSAPFMTIDIPNGGENWFKDSTYIIRWNTNVSDSVSISLMRNGVKLATIKDTLWSFTHTFAWLIPTSVSDDSTYKILVTSLRNPTLSTTSTNNFSIKGKTTGVKEMETIQKSVEIRSYPNPFSGKTNIEFDLTSHGLTTVQIYDYTGKIITTLLHDYLNPGRHHVDWDAAHIPSGIYICKLKFGEVTRQIQLIVKK